jgi:hypothetical protein
MNVISLSSPQSCVGLDVHGDDQGRCQSYCDVSVVIAEIRSWRSLVALAIMAAATDFGLGCDQPPNRRRTTFHENSSMH